MSMMQLTQVESGAPDPRPGVWTWSSPDAPIRIGVDLEMVSNLRRELEKSSTRGEVGGVLLGSANPASGDVEIHGYVLLAPDEQSGDDYRLDMAQVERLRRKHTDLPVIGYFRTQAEGALHLRRPEINLVATHFTERTDIVMLIRTASRQDFKAGFLFWGQDAFVPFSVQDFPFDAAALARQEVEPQRMSFSPIVEAQLPEFTPPLETPVVSAPPAVTREAKRPAGKKSFINRPANSRPNVLVTGAVVASLAGLGIFLLREDRPPASKPAQVAVNSSGNVEAHPASVGTHPASVETPAPAKPAPVAVRTPLDTRPKNPVAVRTTAPVSRANATAAVATEQRVPGQPDISPAPAASTQTAERAQTAPTAVPLAPPPDLSVRQQPPPMLASTAPSTPVPATAVSVPAASAPGPAAAPPASTASDPVAVPPAARDVVVARKTPEPPVVPPKPPQAPSRFVGGWSYPLSNGLYHGREPEVVEISIQETNGRVSGTAYARFRSLSDSGRTLRFQFGGELHPGRTQSFSLQTVDGTKGTVELIPGTTPNLLEVNFRTTPDGGTGQSGNMILMKK